MKIVKPSVVELIPENPIQHIERCGRVCYKSEDKITPESAEKFVGGIVKRGHLSVTEHFRFIVSVSTLCYEQMICAQAMIDYPKDIEPSYLKFSKDPDCCLISGSARGFYEFYQGCPDKLLAKKMTEAVINSILRYSETSQCLFPGITYNPRYALFRLVEQRDLTPEESYIHGWHTLLFTCDRGVSHELVRHRPCSFSQESTRYCNYANGKFGEEITVIKPCFWDEDSDQMFHWRSAMKLAESHYLGLIESGATPQEARSVLPNSLKTELVITATNNEWIHLLNLRCSPAAHPQAREVCEMARGVLAESDPDVLPSRGYE